MTLFEKLIKPVLKLSSLIINVVLIGFIATQIGSKQDLIIGVLKFS